MNAVRILTLVILFSMLGVTWGDDEKKAEPEGAQKTETAKTETPKVTISGVFESEQAAKVKVNLKQAAGVKVKKIVPHGTQVKKGEPVVWFDTEDIDKQLKEAESKYQVAELSMEETKFDFNQFMETQRLDREEAERNWQAAKQAYDAYVEFERKYDIESAEFGLASAKFQLEYAQEDLRQLERMYKEDELTEESEELILKRAKRDVESSEFRLKNTEFRTQQALEQTLPREKAVRESQLARAQMAYDKAMLSLRIAKQKKEIEFSEAKDKLDQQQKDLTELREDRKQHVLEAPEDGLVYHGDIDRGQMAEKRSALEQGTAVNKDQILVTIVSPRRLKIRLDVGEADVLKLREGLQGTAIPTALADVKLPVKVESVSAVPYAKGKFDCELSVDMQQAAGIMPGMGCAVTFETADSKND